MTTATTNMSHRENTTQPPMNVTRAYSTRFVVVLKRIMILLSFLLWLQPVFGSNTPRSWPILYSDSSVVYRLSEMKMYKCICGWYLSSICNSECIPNHGALDVKLRSGNIRELNAVSNRCRRPTASLHKCQGVCPF